MYLSPRVRRVLMAGIAMLVTFSLANVAGDASGSSTDEARGRVPRPTRTQR